MILKAGIFMAAILIVEDDVEFATMLKTFFEKRDYKVETAFSAAEAFKKLSLQPFQVVLTDVRLPDKDGLEILLEVKANYKDVQVITVSYTHLRAHETVLDLVCRLLLEQ